jgi:hypothetical protein
VHSTCRDWTLLDLGSACLPQIVPSGVWNSPPGRNATTLAPLHIGASPCGLLAPPPPPPTGTLHDQEHAAGGLHSRQPCALAALVLHGASPGWVWGASLLLQSMMGPGRCKRGQTYSTMLNQ